MPIYEYQCQACQHQFDALQKLNEKPIQLCPECGKMEAQRLVSAAGFQLKGSGWYATDFKNKTKTNESASTKDTKKSEATATETKMTPPATKKGESD